MSLVIYADIPKDAHTIAVCRRRVPRLVDRSQRMRRFVRCYVEVGCCGERSTSRVISLGAKTRNGGPQKPVPRLV